MQHWWLIGLSIATSVAAQTTIKIGVSQPGENETHLGIVALLALIVQSPLILIGLCLYGIGALSWIALLSRVDLSYAYPFLALNLVLILVVSRAFLGESIPLMRWIGIVVICCGIILVARSEVAGLP